MFKKLRRRFIIVIMIMAGMILLTLFTANCIINYLQVVDTNYKMLKMVAERVDEDNSGDNPITGNKDEMPYFSKNVAKVTAWYNAENSLQYEKSEELFFEIEDTALLEIVNKAMLSTSEQGYVRDYQIRFFKTGENAQGKVSIAFCSCEMERLYIRKLIGGSVITVLVGLIVIFVISIFVSKLLVKPAEEAWKQQQEFIANASHELKTPLTVIIANNNILLNHKDEKIGDKKQWILSNQTEAEQMRLLINDMLYLARSDANLQVREQTVFNLSQVLLLSVLPFDSVAFEKNIEIITDIEENVKIKADENEIKNVISILMDNAVKYSDNGKKITVLLKRVKSRVEISVTNFGDVITEKDKGLIFNRFYRGDKSRSKTVSGFGLGLSIAKDIVVSNGGDIRFDSSIENGTRFTITFQAVD